MTWLPTPWVRGDAPDPIKPTGLGRPYMDGLACPACNATLIGMRLIGDCTICVSCRAMLTMDCDWHIEHQHAMKRAVITRLYLRRPTDAEEVKWLSDARVTDAIRIVAQHHQVHGSPHPNIAPPDEH